MSPILYLIRLFLLWKGVGEVRLAKRKIKKLKTKKGGRRSGRQVAARQEEEMKLEYKRKGFLNSGSGSGFPRLPELNRKNN